MATGLSPIFLQIGLVILAALLAAIGVLVLKNVTDGRTEAKEDTARLERAVTEMGHRFERERDRLWDAIGDLQQRRYVKSS
jgi:hypothetical protein